MADNLTTQSATPATIPASTKISTDDAGAEGHVQKIKLTEGTDGSAVALPADATNGLLVNLGANNDVTVTGTVTVDAGTNLNTSALALESGGNLAAAVTALQVIDNFISGTKGLVTEDNSASILTSLQTIDNFISGARGLVTEDNSAAIKTAVEIIDNFISANRGLVTEDNSAAILVAVGAIKTAVEILDNTVDGTELQVDIRAFPNGLIDSFGHLITGSINNQIDIQFYRDTPANLVTVTSGSGGTATGTGGMATFAAATTASSFAKGVTTPTTIYTAGAEVYALFTAAFTGTGAGTSFQRIGLYDDNNGFFVGKEANSFGVTVRKGGADTTVAKASFSEDTLVGGVGSEFTRDGTPEAIDLTKLNVYRIRFGWVGSAPIRFEVLAPDGNWVTFHKILQPNNAAVPSIEDADLPMTCHVTSGNSGNALSILSNCWTGGTTQALSRIDATLTDQTMAQLTRSVITGETTAGGGGFVNVKVDPSGAVSAAVTGTVTANLAAGTNNIGDVDVLSIAAGDNNIGNVDVLTLPAIPAGTNNIGDVDVLTLPAIPTGTNTIGSVKLTDGTTVATVRELGTNDALNVAMVDGSGNQIVSFGGGTQYTEGDTDASITGSAMMWEDAADTLKSVSAATPLPVNVVAGGAGDGSILDGVSSAIKATVLDYTNSNPLAVRLTDTSGDYVGAGAGTQYTEDAAAAANPTGTALILVREDGRAGTLTSTDGDNVAARGNNKGELYVKTTDSDALLTTIDGDTGNISTKIDTIAGAVAGTEMQVDVLTSALPAGASTLAEQQSQTTHLATLAGAVSATHVQVDVLTAPSTVVTNTVLSVTGGGTEATAQRVTIANDSTGVLSIDDNGASLTVDGTVAVSGTVAVTQSGTWDEVGINDSGNSITVDNAQLSVVGSGTEATAMRVTIATDSTGVLSVDDNGSTLSIDDGAGSVTVDAPVATPVFVRLSDGASAITTLPVSLASVPSHAVTNAGTFAVQVDGALLTSSQLLDDTVYTAGTSTYTETSSKGNLALAVRRDADTTLADTTNEMTPLQVNAAGQLKTALITALPAGTNNIGDVDILSIAAGNNNIGDVDIASIAAGDNNIGNVDIVSGTITTVTTLTGGGIAHDGTDSGNPLKIGARAVATPSTATMVVATDRSDAIADLDGSLFVRNVLLGDIITEALSNTDGASTASTNFGATASTRNYITSMTAFRTDTATTMAYIDIRDGTAGAVLYRIPLPPSGGVTINNGGAPILYSTANTALAIDVSSALTTVYLSWTGFKSKARA
jgi:hypothetical protein